MSAHAPGPWKMRQSRIGWWIETPTDKSRQFAYGAIPADVWYRDKEERDNCEALANARLIAAAPDLLAALEGWQDLHDAMIEEGGDMQQLPDGLIEKFAVVQSGLLVSTRAAIAKAKGETT